MVKNYDYSTNMVGQTFDGIDFDKCSFIGADLSGCTFMNSYMRGCDFS